MIDPLDPDDEALSDEQLAELDQFLVEQLDALVPEDEVEPSDEQLAEDLGVELPEE